MFPEDRLLRRFQGPYEVSWILEKISRDFRNFTEELLKNGEVISVTVEQVPGVSEGTVVAVTQVQIFLEVFGCSLKRFRVLEASDLIQISFELTELM